jgi:hypothetical protein
LPTGQGSAVMAKLTGNQIVEDAVRYRF